MDIKTKEVKYLSDQIPTCLIEKYAKYIRNNNKFRVISNQVLLKIVRTDSLEEYKNEIDKLYFGYCGKEPFELTKNPNDFAIGIFCDCLRSINSYGYD